MHRVTHDVFGFDQDDQYKQVSDRNPLKWSNPENKIKKNQPVTIEATIHCRIFFGTMFSKWLTLSHQESDSVMQKAKGTLYKIFHQSSTCQGFNKKIFFWLNIVKHLSALNPFPNTPWFIRVCMTSCNVQFLLFPQSFLPFRRTFCDFHQI